MNELPKFTINNEDIARFNDDGVICLRNAIDAKWLNHLKRAAKDLESNPSTRSQTLCGTNSPITNTNLTYFTDLEISQHKPQFDRFARCSPVATIAGTLMKSQNVCFLYDQYFRQQQEGSSISTTLTTTATAKDPSTTSTTTATVPVTPWHQDQPYWSVEGSQVVSIWVPLDPTPPGFDVQFIQGSHRWQEHCPTKFASGAAYKGTGQPNLPNIDQGIQEGTYQVLRFPDCMPGDVIAFSAMTVHGQSTNSSNSTKSTNSTKSSSDPSSWWLEHPQFRRLATRFTGDNARYKVRQGEAANVIPSSLYPALGLKDGDEMECERFPLVWTRSNGLKEAGEETGEETKRR